MKNQTNSKSGPVTIPMTNDYLFRALLQRNNKVLKGLIGSVLHIPVEEITSVEIQNPIELGESIDAKDFYLDVKVELNKATVLNLEMQVLNEKNWTERSLSYLCRTFDNLNKGANYIDVKPVIQICFLDFTLFPEYPEFYANYYFMNVKNYTKYSDKIRLGVIDLKHIELATEEDKKYQIDYWAALFKSTTWEEIKMLAQNNEYIEEASETIYQLTQEEKIRLQCEAREEYYRLERYRQHEQEVFEKEKTVFEEEKTVFEKEKAFFAKEKAEKERENAVIRKENADMRKENGEIKKELEEKDAEIARLKAELAKK